MPSVSKSRLCGSSSTALVVSIGVLVGCNIIEPDDPEGGCGPTRQFEAVVPETGGDLFDAPPPWRFHYNEATGVRTFSFIRFVEQALCSVDGGEVDLEFQVQFATTTLGTGAYVQLHTDSDDGGQPDHEVVLSQQSGTLTWTGAIDDLDLEQVAPGGEPVFVSMEIFVEFETLEGDLADDMDYARAVIGLIRASGTYRIPVVD